MTEKERVEKFYKEQEIIRRKRLEKESKWWYRFIATPLKVILYILWLLVEVPFIIIGVCIGGNIGVGIIIVVFIFAIICFLYAIGDSIEDPPLIFRIHVSFIRAVNGLD